MTLLDVRMTRNYSAPARFHREMGPNRPARLSIMLALACAVVLSSPLAARAAAPLTWSSHGSEASAEGPLSLSCPSESLCVAVDHAGEALLSSNPAAPAPTWASTTIDAHPLTGVSCPSESFCVAVDGEGDALASTAPAAGSWSAPAPVDPGRPLTGVSCASPTLCVAVGEDGGIFVSTDPSAGEWSAAPTVAGEQPLTGVSCASTALCVAVAVDGQALSSTEPANAGKAWSSYPTGAPLHAVSCTPAGACVATAGTAVFASADPGAPDAGEPLALGPTWSGTPVDESPLLAVSCAASSLCVALDEAGGALASDDATSAIPRWQASSPPSGAGISPPSAIACLPGGVCLAAGAPAAGGVLTSFRGSVPAPEAATGGAHAIAARSAKVSGTVNPQDAELGACLIEYGTSTAYGQSAPCEAPPAPTDSAQGVSATLEGLSPGTVYHYRLLAIDGAGQGAGADQTFTTLPPPPLVYPKPTISGKPIAGHWLTCKANLPAGAHAAVTYVWLRGLTPIEGQAGRRYRPTAADAGHHLQCQVTATNEGGSVTRTSPFVAIPIKGVLAAVGETDVVHAKLPHTRVEVAVSCSQLATQGCEIEAKLTVVETLRGHKLLAVAARARRRHRRGAAARRHRAHAASHPRAHARRAARRRASAGGSRAKAARRPHRVAHAASRHAAKKRKPPPIRHRTVTIGSAHVSVAPSHDRVVKVFLNRAGRNLLHRRSEGVKAQLTVIGTVVGVLKARLRREVVAISA